MTKYDWLDTTNFGGEPSGFWVERVEPERDPLKYKVGDVVNWGLGGQDTIVAAEWDDYWGYPCYELSCGIRVSEYQIRGKEDIKEYGDAVSKADG